MKHCIGPECEREQVVKQMCKAHYDQSRRRPGQPLTALLPPHTPSNQTKECVAPKCDRRPVAHNLCFAHYARVNYHDLPIAPLKPRTLRADFPEHCTGPECTRVVRHSGLCASHIAQKQRTGTLKPLRAYNKAKNAQEGASEARTNSAGSPIASGNQGGSE